MAHRTTYLSSDLLVWRDFLPDTHAASERPAGFAGENLQLHLRWCMDSWAAAVQQLFLLLSLGSLFTSLPKAAGYCIQAAPSSSAIDAVAALTSDPKVQLSPYETVVLTSVANISAISARSLLLNHDGYEDAFIFSIDLEPGLLEGTACSAHGDGNANNSGNKKKSWIIARLSYAGSYLNPDGSTRTELLAFPNLHLRLAAERHPACQGSEEQTLIYDPGYTRGLQQVVLAAPTEASDWVRILVQKVQLDYQGLPANTYSMASSHAPLDFAMVNVTVSCATNLTREPCYAPYIPMEDLEAGARPKQCSGVGNCQVAAVSSPSRSSGLMPSRCDCDKFHTGFTCQHDVIRLPMEKFVNVTVALRRWVHYAVTWVPKERPSLFAEANLLPGFPRYSMDSYGSPFLLCIQPLPESGEDPVGLLSTSTKFAKHCDLVGAGSGRVSHFKVFNTGMGITDVYLVSLYGREVVYDNLFVNENMFEYFSDRRVRNSADMASTRILAPQPVSEFGVTLRASWISRPCPSYWNSGVCNGTGADCQAIKPGQWLRNDVKLDPETMQQYVAFNTNFTIYTRQSPPSYCQCGMDPATGQRLQGHNCQTRVTQSRLASKGIWRHNGLVGWAISETIFLRLPESAPACITVSMLPLPCLSVWDPHAGSQRMVFSEDLLGADGQGAREPGAGGEARRAFVEYKTQLEINLDVNRFSYFESHRQRVIRLSINGQNCWPACFAADRPNELTYFGSDHDTPPYHKDACPLLDEVLKEVGSQPTYSLFIKAQSSCKPCEGYKCPGPRARKYSYALLGLLGLLPFLAFFTYVWCKQMCLQRRGENAHQAGPVSSPPSTFVPDSVIETFAVYKFKAGQPIPRKPATPPRKDKNASPSKLDEMVLPASPFLPGSMVGRRLPVRMFASDVSIPISAGMLTHATNLANSSFSSEWRSPSTGSRGIRVGSGQSSTGPGWVSTLDGELSTWQEGVGTEFREQGVGVEGTISMVGSEEFSTKSEALFAPDERGPHAGSKHPLTGQSLNPEGLSTGLEVASSLDKGTHAGLQHPLINQSLNLDDARTALDDTTASDARAPLGLQHPLTSQHLNPRASTTGLHLLLPPADRLCVKMQDGLISQVSNPASTSMSSEATLTPDEGSSLATQQCLTSQILNPDRSRMGSEVSKTPDPDGVNAVVMEQTLTGPTLNPPHMADIDAFEISSIELLSKALHTPRGEISVPEGERALQEGDVGMPDAERALLEGERAVPEQEMGVPLGEKGLLEGKRVPEGGRSLPEGQTGVLKRQAGGGVRLPHSYEGPQGHDHAASTSHLRGHMELIEASRGSLPSWLGSEITDSLAGVGNSMPSTIEALSLEGLHMQAANTQTASTQAANIQAVKVHSAGTICAAGAMCSSTGTGRTTHHTASLEHNAHRSMDQELSSSYKTPALSYRPLDPIAPMRSHAQYPFHATNSGTHLQHTLQHLYPHTGARWSTHPQSDTNAGRGSDCEVGEGDDGEEDDSTCMICLVEYEEGEEILLLPCWHVFHKDCIKQWMANHITCPACRHCLVPIQEDPEANPSAMVTTATQAAAPAAGTTAAASPAAEDAV